MDSTLAHVKHYARAPGSTICNTCHGNRHHQPAQSPEDAQLFGHSIALWVSRALLAGLADGAVCDQPNVECGDQILADLHGGACSDRDLGLLCGQADEPEVK